MKNTNYSIDILGPYPPPYGGISIHISRMLPFIAREGIISTVYNHYNFENKSLNIFATNKSALWWATYLFKRKSSIVHIHQFSILHFPYTLFLSWTTNKKIIITIHNEKIISYSQPLRKAIFFALRISRIEKIISVSKKLHGEMERSSFRNVVWLPAYVPPTLEREKQLSCSFSKKIAFNAWRIDNKRLAMTYGLDLLIQLAIDNPKFCFYLFIGDIASKDYLEKSILPYTLENCVMVYGESMVEYLPGTDIFLRLNREDAFGVSTKEALDLGVPVIASDVCVRPSGCILYRTGDFSDLSLKFKESIVSPRSKLLDGRTQSDYHTRLIALYKETLRNTTYQ